MAFFKPWGQNEDNLTNQLLELKNWYGQEVERKQNKNTQALLGIATGVNDAQNSNQLEHLLSILNTKTSDYYSNTVNKVARDRIYNDAVSKKQDFQVYKSRIDNMKNKFFGEGIATSVTGETIKTRGFKDLDDQDIRDNWTYDYIASELQAINDFEAIFFEDYEQQNPVSFEYNANGILTDDLRRRVSVYKDKIYAGIEASKHDNLIRDHEIVYILTGDKEGMATSRTENMKNLSNSIKNDSKAIGAIKGNIASMLAWKVKSKKGKSMEIQDTFTAYKDKAVNLEGQFFAEWETGAGEGEEWDSYRDRRLQDALATTPEELINQWRIEIAGYDARKKMFETEYGKHAGFKHEGLEDLKDSTISLFEDRFGTNPLKLVKPESLDDIPLDLISDDESGHYYSAEKDLYYDKEVIEKLLFSK